MYSVYSDKLTICLHAPQTCTCTFNIKKEANCKQYDGPSKDLIDPLEQAVLPSTLVGEDYGDTHDPDEPGKHKVGNRETIPLTVVKEPIASTTIVDKDHYHQGEAVKLGGGGLGEGEGERERERESESSNREEKGEKRETYEQIEQLS